jgi:[NiFe] hydrogenase assembly HybE family chaperone
MTELTTIAPLACRVTAGDPSPRLEAAYTATALRMRDLGFFNPALRVEAIGFAPWQAHWLGVMVTPWFINLMLLPREGPPAVRPGAKRGHRFPAGDYEFIGGHDAVIGAYEICSLFSPVLEFADHETAREVARLALGALLDPDPETATPTEESTAASGLPMSKRDFLRGRFLRRAE